MLCALIFYVSGGTYSLTSTSNDRFLRNFFMAGLFICQKSAERKSPKKYFSNFSFDDWPGIRTQAFTTNNWTHYLQDYHGDYPIAYILNNLCFRRLHILGDFSAILYWQQFTHVSYFVSLSKISNLVCNLTMSRLTNEQRLQIIEFYYRNTCSLKKVHLALLPFCVQFNRPTTVKWYPIFFCSKCKSLNCMACCFNKTIPQWIYWRRDAGNLRFNAFRLFFVGPC